MSRQRLILLIAVIILIALSWLGILKARSGLTIRSLSVNDIPRIFMAPQNANKVADLLIAHGFAGSKQLMLGYSYTLPMRVTQPCFGISRGMAVIRLR
jgi:hypothetical protein